MPPLGATSPGSNTPTTVPWSEVEPGMQTGDLVLFAGSRPLSRWIELLTVGPFSHATMVYRPDPAAPPLLWQEAPQPIVTDPRTQTLHAGAQLGDALSAAQVISSLGDVPWYVPLAWQRPPDVGARMDEVLSTYEQLPFGTVLEMALDYAVGRLYGQSTGDAVLYCAALVATTYTAIGVLGNAHPANWYSPNSFSPSQAAGLPWAAGASLGPPVQVSLPPGGPVGDAAMSAGWPAGPLAPVSLPAPPPHLPAPSSG